MSMLVTQPLERVINSILSCTTQEQVESVTNLIDAYSALLQPEPSASLHDLISHKERVEVLHTLVSVHCKRIGVALQGYYDDSNSNNNQ